ncbi:MAG: BamA/TamA family outer membrane protein [Chitinophagales bacterium]|nr:BamA/TamA family outer membrane protein [Chitinophagales bacterium]
MMENKVFLLFFLSICMSCSLSRTLPEGEQIYTGAKIKIKKEGKNFSTAELKSTYTSILKTPKPNKKFMGIYWRLRFYNLFHSKKKRKVWMWFQKRLGEPPVIYDEQLTEKTEQLFKNRAFNQGFFNTQVKAVVKKRRRKASVKYHVSVEPPYLLSNLSNGVSDSLIRSQINAIRSTSLLKTGELYKLELLKQERERITTALRQNGHYFFRSSDLKFLADTLNSNHKVGLELVLKENVDSINLLPQTIHRIIVYSDLNFEKKDDLPIDTVEYEGLTIISSRELLRSSTLREAIVLRTGKRYSTNDHRATLQRLSFLQYYQFIDVQFTPSSMSDSLLDVTIKLTPRKVITIEGSIGGSIKAGLYAGPEISLGYLNRNLFRGAEQLRINFSGNYNFPLDVDIASRFEQKATIELSKPGLIIPFKKNRWVEEFIAQTKAAFSFSSDKIKIPLNGTQDFLIEEGFTNLAERLNADTTFAPFIVLDNYDLSLTYQWRYRPEIQHELTPINIVWQAPRYEVEELRRLLIFIFLLSDEDNSEGALLNLEQMFIFKPNYVYRFDSRLKKLRTHNFFYRGKLSVVGNRLLERNSSIVRENAESQFLQWENDWRHYWHFSEKQAFAWRLSTKFSFPFRNEVLLPFFDLYSVGGPNSLRSFQPRQVGPGSVEPSGQTFFFTGTGDILLEGSMEWRPKLTSLLELGFFVDAGNVWLFKGGTRNDDASTFHLDSFYRQLAVGGGFGFRFDFDVLLLRMDLGFPFTKPWLPEGQRWVSDKLQLNDAVFNLAFGYSF